MEPKLEGFLVGDIVEHWISGEIGKVFDRSHLHVSVAWANPDFGHIDNFYYFLSGKLKEKDKYPSIRVIERPKKKRKVEVDIHIRLTSEGAPYAISFGGGKIDTIPAKLTYEVEE